MQHDQDCSTVKNEGILHLDSQHELHEIDQQYEENLYTPSLENIEDNHCLSKRKQKVLSPLSEDEIDQLLKGQVTTKANVGLECAHGQGGVDETSSSFENDDSIEIRFIDQWTYNIFFHEDDQENLRHDQDFSTVEDEGVLPLDSQHELHEMDQ